MNIMTPKDEIELLESRLRIFRGQLNAILTDIEDPININKAIQKEIEQIQSAQGRIDLLVYRRNNLHTFLKEKQDQIQLMTDKLQRLRNRNTTARLERLRQELINLGMSKETIDGYKTSTNNNGDNC